MSSVIERFESAIKAIPDFPKKGILFRDVMPVLADPDLSKDVIQEIKSRWENKGVEAVAGVESRGFLFGVGLAGILGVPFIALRKAGKLPGETFDFEYDLEYGSATLEVQQNALKAGANVLIHDDLLATGGTAEAAAQLIKKAGGKVAGYSFLIELAFFNAKEKLKTHTEEIDYLVSF